MKKSWYTLFNLLFLLLCTVPLLAMLVLGPSEAAANEVLASKPVLLTGNGLNIDFLTQLSDYIGDRFAFRQELITANAHLTASLFRESSADSVILGKDGWLYYASTLDDYTGASAMSDRELYRAARTLSLARSYTESQGARFLFTVPPNKNTLYPSQMPDRYPAARQPGNLERLTLLLKQQNVPFCDLCAVLSRSDTPVYYKTDSHWDGYGSALACDALIECLNGTSRLSTEPFTLTDHRGDLYEMLYPAGTLMEQGRTISRERTFTYTSPLRAADDLTIRTESSGEMGSLLMFRDSFGNLLHADLAERFSRAVFIRSTALRLDLLDGAGTVIFELVERNLPQLLTNPPVMPAPVRTFTPPADSIPAEIEWTRQSAPELPGLVRYTARLSLSAPPDVDSPIYVSLDGTVYEASPSAPAGQDFTLYAPEATELQVYIRQGNIWRCCTDLDQHESVDYLGDNS